MNSISPTPFQKARCLGLALLTLVQAYAFAATQNPLDPVAGKHIAQESQQPILLNVAGKQLDARQDAVAIAQYFAKRPADAFVSGQMKPFLTKQAVSEGLELRGGKLTLPLFKATPFPQDPTWGENPFKDDYWVFNLHSLLLTRYLMAAHHSTGEDWYLKTLETLVQDWITDNSREPRPSPFSWNDHSTAMRLENLLYTFEYVRSRGASPEFIRDLLTSIHLHCSILADDAFYSKHTNHGLDQSYRLYWAGAAIPEFVDAAGWRDTGRTRTVDELGFALSAEGVHVENSPAYHFRHLNIMAQIGRIFSNYEQASLRSLIGERLNGALKFGAYIIKPDGHQPMFGDTQDTEALGWKEWIKSYADVDGFSNVLYSVTAGARGTPPKETDLVFKESGYAVFRDQWRLKDFDQTVYVALKTGFLSTTHRHQDDLSILLYGYGEDWLIDSGLYRYDEKDPMRRFVRSAAAHNLATVDDVEQIYSKAGLNKSRIDSFTTGEAHASVTASHELFEGCQTSRKLEYFKPSRLTVEDQITPNDGQPHTYRVLFHVPADKRVQIVSNTVTVYSPHSAKALRLRALRGNFNKVYTQAGQREPHYQGWVSHVYDKVEPATCIVFETRSRALKSLIELEFLTEGAAPPHESSSTTKRADHYGLVTVDVECRKQDPPLLQRRAIFGDLGGRQYGLPMIYDELQRHHAKGIFFVDFSMFYFAEPLLKETIASIRQSGNDVALHLHWNQLPRELQGQRAVVLHQAANYFAKETGEPLKAYRGGSYVIDDAIAAALRHEGITMDFSFFAPSQRECSFYKRDLGNAFTWYDGLYAVPVTTMPGEPTKKLDINWRPVDDLLVGVDNQPVPVLFLHSFSFLTPWNDWQPAGVAESLSGASARHPGDKRLTLVDQTALRSLDSVLAHWEQRGVHTLDLKELDTMKEELIKTTSSPRAGNVAKMSRTE